MKAPEQGKTGIPEVRVSNRARPGWGRALACLAVMAALAFGTAGVASSADSFEFPLKGAFLVKFGGFVEWPAGAFHDAGTPFVIGILGDDPFGARLDQAVQNHQVQGRPVVIRRFKRVDQVRETQILYIGMNERERREQILASLRGTSTLTVSDGFPPPAGMINFIIEENKVRFEIDSDAAERAGLKVSSKLLKVARSTGKGE